MIRYGIKQILSDDSEKCTSQMFLLDFIWTLGLKHPREYNKLDLPPPTVFTAKKKSSSQRGILNDVKMMNSLKVHSEILSYRNIDNTHISRRASIQYGRSCPMVS